ncbi:GNAT family N-acetyltransferase [uncultured Clostridium sp.]|uniref:GNAT family N-acetyltransferase n=1 Tax=uncultured Clostridium sp. TaxID=59620 RepID=UPI0028F0B9C6|nr:GNAT family N-acetyltransferase [uncultured Clostridium sp.]
MNRIELILPSKELKEKIMDYKKEFIINRDNMDGTAGLKNAPNFESWLDAIKDNSTEETVREGFVPSSTYLAIRKSDKKIVGMIDIRHSLNDYLLNFGGNIGYSIRKSERRKGYAKEMLSLALDECRKFNIDRVLITCYKDNIASAKTIISNDGILENEVLEKDKITQRYWIDLL